MFALINADPVYIPPEPVPGQAAYPAGQWFIVVAQWCILLCLRA